MFFGRVLLNVGWGKGRVSWSNNDQRLNMVGFVWFPPKGRPGMSDVTLLSGISGLAFDSPFLSPLFFFLPSPFALSVLSFFSANGPFS